MKKKENDEELKREENVGGNEKEKSENEPEKEKPTGDEEGKEKANTPPDPGPEVSPIRSVSLKGWAAARVGTHSAHVRTGLVVNFRNGIAEVKEEIETELREAGIIE
ncbi:hypothetical protein [Cohnella sp.]|uniref:hypothetical protein n=1 Tax=Cohnella sp. TaxID=1883426 RepID=UPI003704359F